MFASLGMSPKPIEALAPMPEFPWALSYIWDWFQDFSIGLTVNGMAPPSASWGDVQHWTQAMLLDLEPWEKKLLVRLAGLRAAVLSEASEDKAKSK